MTRLLFLAFVIAWVGLSLLFASLPSLQRPSLVDRLRAYTPGAPARGHGIRAAQSFRDVIGPLANAIGSGLARAFGVNEDLRVRLERIHADEEPSEFRVRQVAWATWAMLGTGAVLSLAQVPTAVVAAAAWVVPLLVFLVVEQRLANRSAEWQRRIELEMPVVAEQLAMLLAAGFSLGSALQRIAQRSDGAIATDLRRVVRRVRQGISESDALDEWSAVARVPAAERLVSVLRLHGETSDLGRLVSDEARVSREEAHRRLLEAMERKAQAVWIPVTVAALVPGVIFLAVPFLHALTFFATT